MADILRFSANMSEETLIASARLHNQFPPDTAFPQIDQLSEELEDLCEIIAKYKAEHHFRLRLLHRHITIPEGHILLGSSTTEPSGFWTKPTPITEIDLQKIHPHIISVNATAGMSESENDLLFPSEFRDGPPVSIRSIDRNFFIELSHYLWAKGLENTFGLEMTQGQTGKMIEFSFDIGSLLLKEEEVKAEMMEDTSSQFQLQETGWTITVRDGTVCKTGETRCVFYTTGHIKFTDSKAGGVVDVLKMLRDEGVLNK